MIKTGRVIREAHYIAMEGTPGDQYPVAEFSVSRDPDSGLWCVWDCFDDRRRVLVGEYSDRNLANAQAKSEAESYVTIRN